MTVKELINKLQQFDENLQVCTQNGWGTPCIESVFEGESERLNPEQRIVIID